LSSAVAYFFLFGIPVVGGYFLGRRRGRRGWLWGLLSYVGLLILWLLPDLTKTPEQRKEEKAIAKATAHLEKAESRRVLGAYGGVVLYEDGLVTPDGSCDLSPEIKATVQDAGSLQKYVTSRVTLTRALTIGIFAIGAKKKKTHTVDTRELYLLIETREFASLVTCDANDGARVRQFATQINNAGIQFETLRAERDARVEQAQKELAALEPAEPPRALTVA
jgi:hypothetical protein